MDIALDTRSLMIAGLLEVLMLGGLMAFISRWRPKEQAFPYWTAGNLLLATGFILLGLRDVVPDFWSAVAGNSLLIIAILAFFEGLRRFLGLRGFAALSIIILVFGIIGEIYFLYGWDNLNARAVLFSVIAAIMAGRFIYLVFSDIPREIRASSIFTGVFWVIMAGLMVFRSIYLIAFDPLESLFQNDLIQTLTFVGVIVAANGWSFGFVLMTSEKAEAQLRAAQIELERLSVTDFLTGAYNRRHFYQIGEHEFETARRYVRPLSVIMLDIDDFKRINDSFGHTSGDQVLTRLVFSMQDHLRRSDVLARFGGEEFAILMPETELDAALRTAERLRQLAAAVQPDEQPDMSLTISVGVTSLKPGDRSLDDLIRRADNAMYTAKNNGRDQVIKT